MKIERELTREIKPSFRVSAVQGMFDIPAADSESVVFRAELPDIDDDSWRIGAIIGPSGSGKSSIAQAIPDSLIVERVTWSDTESIIEQMPGDIESAARLFTSVGLASPKAWIRPWGSLSTGQRARADLAWALAQESANCIVFDEFTSTVDRVVAKAMSHAVNKTVTRGGPKLIAVSCHYDMVDWLRPDWVWDMSEGVLSKERVQRPAIYLKVERADRSWWPAFAQHHYLSADIAVSAQCYTAWVRLGDDEEEWRLAGFFSTMPAIGIKGWDRGHRTVVLPDFQGLGIGNAMIEGVAEWLWTNKGRRFRAVTSSRPIIFHRAKRPEMWRCVFAPHMKAAQGKTGAINSTSAGRLTTSWEYIPKDLRGETQRSGHSQSQDTAGRGRSSTQGQSVTASGGAAKISSKKGTAGSISKRSASRGKVRMQQGGRSVSLKPRGE